MIITIHPSWDLYHLRFFFMSFDPFGTVLNSEAMLPIRSPRESPDVSHGGLQKAPHLNGRRGVVEREDGGSKGGRAHRAHRACGMAVTCCFFSEGSLKPNPNIVSPL